jgi:hypothetical protein
MKKWVLGLVLLFTLSSLPAFSATPPKPGSVCSKQGITKTYKGKKYTCIKSGKKLVWNKGVVLNKQLNPAETFPSPYPTPKATVSTNATPNSAPSKSPTKPSNIKSLTANWKDDDNKKSEELYVRFTHDTTMNSEVSNNTGVDQYSILLTYAIGTPQEISYPFYWKDFTKSNPSKTWKLKPEENISIFGWKNQFRVTVTAIDSLNRTESDPVWVDSETYQITLAPPQITVIAGISSYSVNWSNSNTDPNLGWKGLIHIWEDTGTGYVGVGSGNQKSIIIYTSNYLTRNVKAKFSDGKNNFTDFGNIVSITPKFPN